VFSVSPAEILTIAVVALLVFGPRRLPEIARKAGKILREVRNAATELTSGLEAEYKDIVDPVRDAREEMRDAIAGLDRKVTLPTEPGDAPSADEPPSGKDSDESAS